MAKLTPVTRKQSSISNNPGLPKPPINRGFIVFNENPTDLVGFISVLISPTPSISPSLTPSVTPSITPSLTPSISRTPSLTPSITPSLTPSISRTPSITPSITPSVTPSFTPSISITPSISPSSTATSSLMYDLLSAAGKTAYNATSASNFFSCSVDDYNAVFNGLSGTSKVGNTDVIFSTALGASYTATCASVLPQSNSLVDINNYIIGFATKMLATPVGTTVTPLISTTYKGTYTSISNSPAIGGSNRVYYLRKEPTLITTASYVGHVASAGNFDQTTTSYTNAGFDCSSPYSTWSNRNGTMPHFQILVTTTKPF